MPICPQGHDSPTADYCDYCGWPMSAPGHQGQPQAAPQSPYQQHPPSTTGLVMCPICSTPQTERYCEECGYDYDLASPSRRVQQPGAQQPVAPPQPPPAPAYTGYPPQQPGQQQPGPQPTQQQAPQTPRPGGDYGLSQPYQQQPQPYEQQQPYQPQQQQPYEVREPQPAQQRVQQQPQTSPPYGVPAGTYGGVSYATGDTSGGFSTDFMLQPPVGEQQPPQHQQPQAGRGTWVAVVAADRQYFDDMMGRSGPDAAGLYFPPYSPERRVPMTGRGQLRIGRRSHQRGTVPEIDLSIAPEDPGASHQHALLQEQPDGGWVVIDQDSTNGTSINGSPDPISAHQPVALEDGDRIHVGAWTTITVHRA